MTAKSAWDFATWYLGLAFNYGAAADGTPPPWAEESKPVPDTKPDPKQKDPSTETPIPPADNPPAPNPAPPPRKVYDPPLTIPVPIPLPTMPEPVFPTEIDLNQQEHKISHAKRESLVSRRYGCMLFEPVRENIKVVRCESNPENFWNEWSQGQEEAFKSFLGWLLGIDKMTPQQIAGDPKLASFGALTGFDIGSAVLGDKFCELAFIALTLSSRGAFNKLLSAELFVWGCQGLTALLLWWTNRNKQTVGNFPIIYNTYKTIETIACDPADFTPSAGLGDIMDYDKIIETTSLVIPDPGDFEHTEGKFMQIYWVIEDGGHPKYMNVTQLHNPIPELWDCLDSNGDPDPSQVNNLEGNWETYIEPLHRTIGYVEAKLFAKGRKAPISTGWFIDKDDAKQYFQELTKLTLLVPREHNNPVYYEYPDEILFDDPETENEADTGEVPKPASLKRKMNNAGKKLIPRKVVIGERKSTVSEPRVLVEYYNNKILIPSNEA